MSMIASVKDDLLATQAEQVTSMTNNIDNISELGKFIIEKDTKNKELFIQLNAR